MPFGSNAVLASITTDYMAEMKYQLTKFLVGEKDMAPRTPSLEEVIWTSLKKNLPPQAFSKNLLSDKKEFSAYLNIIRTQVEASYKEESKLTQAMVSKSWKFVFRIAIDAYPQKSPVKSEHKIQPGEKNGVLVFILESKLKETLNVNNKEEKDNITNIENKTTSTEIESNDKKNKRKRSEQESDEERGQKKKVKNKEKRPQKESMGELLRVLQLSTEDLGTGHIVASKDFPETATDFFDQIGAWYSSVVASKQQQLDQQISKPHMYQ